jgi:hypothetical protein
MAAAWRENPRDDGQAASLAVDRLRAALAECPDGEEGGVVMLDLPDDAPQVQAFLGRILVSVPPPAPPGGEKLDRAELVALESALSHADLARFARRTQVWEMREDGMVPAWEHRRLDLDELAASLSPGRDLRAEPWLFARLSRTLDRRVLALLADPEEVRGARPFAIDVSPASILDPVFLRFDRALPGALRGRVVLRLPAEELVLMPELVAPAVRLAQGRGYRTLLAAGAPVLAALFPQPRSAIELVELSWPLAQQGVVPSHGAVLSGIGETAGLTWAAENGVRYVAGPAADLRAKARGAGSGARLGALPPAPSPGDGRLRVGASRGP